MGQRGILNPEQRRYRRAELIKRPVFEWGGVFEKWSRGFVKRNFWRVSALFLSEEDALQECAIVFVRCRNKYEGRLDEPKHMMALYQRALERSWHTFALRDRSKRTFSLGDMSREEVEQTQSGGPLAVLLSQCDAELTALITAIIDAPSEFLAIIFGDDDKDTGRITRKAAYMLGLKPGRRDLIAEIKELLL